MYVKCMWERAETRLYRRGGRGNWDPYVSILKNTNRIFGFSLFVFFWGGGGKWWDTRKDIHH